MSEAEVIKIEVGKMYSVSNQYKKTFVEEEHYMHPDDNSKVITVETGWRFGTVLITVTNEDEAETLNAAQTADNDDEFYINSFEEVEPDSTWDGCWVDYHFRGFTEEEAEEIRSTLEDPPEDMFGFYDVLTQIYGFDNFDMDTTIWGAVHVEEFVPWSERDA